MRVAVRWVTILVSAALAVAVVPPAVATATASHLHLDVVTQEPWTAGAVGTIVVSARNADDSLDTGYLGSLRFSFPPAPGGGPGKIPPYRPPGWWGSAGGIRAAEDVLPGPYTFIAADAGQHTFELILTSAPSMHVEATGLEGSDTIYGDREIAVVAGAPASLRLYTPMGTVYSGVELDDQPIAVVVDAFGNYGAVGPVNVTLGVSAGSLICTGGTSRTAVLGVAVFDGCRLSHDGQVHLVASAPGLTDGYGATVIDVLYPVPSRRHTLTLSPPAATVTYGGNLELGLTIGGGRHLVGLLRLPPGGMWWDHVESAFSDNVGQAAFSIAPEENALYKVCRPGVPGEESGECSNVVRVLVRQQVLLEVGGSTSGGVHHIAPRTRTTFTAHVLPVDLPPYAPSITFQVLTQQRGRWRPVAETTVAAPSGSASWTTSFRPGQYQVKAIAPATPYLYPGYTTPIRVSVP